MARSLPLLVGALLALIGWARVAIGGIPFSGERLEECRVPLVEGVSYSSELALWPPGATRCEWAGPGGSGTGWYVPWGEWLVVLLGAIGAGLLASALLPGLSLRLLRDLAV